MLVTCWQQMAWAGDSRHHRRLFIPPADGRGRIPDLLHQPVRGKHPGFVPLGQDPGHHLRFRRGGKGQDEAIIFFLNVLIRAELPFFGIHRGITAQFHLDRKPFLLDDPELLVEMLFKIIIRRKGELALGDVHFPQPVHGQQRIKGELGHPGPGRPGHAGMQVQGVVIRKKLVGLDIKGLGPLGRRVFINDPANAFLVHGLDQSADILLVRGVIDGAGQKAAIMVAPAAAHSQGAALLDGPFRVFQQFFPQQVPGKGLAHLQHGQFRGGQA